MDDFDRDVLERLDVPLHSPYSLTPKIIFYGLVCVGLVWIFGSSSWVVPFALGMFGLAVIKWLLDRRKTKLSFLLLVKKAHLEFPDINLDEVLLGVLAAWESRDLPPIRVVFPSGTNQG